MTEISGFNLAIKRLLSKVFLGHYLLIAPGLLDIFKRFTSAISSLYLVLESSVTVSVCKDPGTILGKTMIYLILKRPGKIAKMYDGVNL